MQSLQVDRVENLLLAWSAWYRHCSLRIGYPSASVGMTSGGINCYDDLAHQADDYAARTMNALIENLKPTRQCAVRYVHLGELWKFPQGDVQTFYEMAKEELQRGLNRWGLC